MKYFRNDLSSILNNLINVSDTTDDDYSEVGSRLSSDFYCKLSTFSYFSASAYIVTLKLDLSQYALPDHLIFTLIESLKKLWKYLIFKGK